MLAVLVFPIATGILSQAADVPAFEVATIKPSTDLMVWSGFLFPGTQRPDRTGLATFFEASHVTVKAMVAFAYDIRDFYVSGGPGWASGDRFDIVAKTDTSATHAQMRVMMQTLLKERFQLSVRHENRDATVYQLVVAKGAPKLKETSRKDGPGGLRFLGRGNVEGLGTAMTGLSSYLQTLLGNVVLDKTGLTGNYDFKLTWVPDEAQAGKPGAQGLPATNGAEESGPSIFTALQEQLGLKLDASKGPVETLVIERVEKPSEN